MNQAKIWAVTDEMRKYMPHSCGEWADNIDAASGKEESMYLRHHHVILESELRRYGHWSIHYDADAVVHWSFAHDKDNRCGQGVSLNDCLDQIDAMDCA